jgi:CheY-like chemotaxis protein
VGGDLTSRGMTRTQPSKTKTAESTAVKCRILHVNDTDADHEVLTKLLELDRSFSVERARSGLEALQQLRHNAQVPNLVLVTWSFAQMACAEFIDQMKSDKRLAVIPIIVMASAMSPDEVMQAYDAGAACVLQQGSDPDSLVRSLQALKNFWSLVLLPFCDSPAHSMPQIGKAFKLTTKQRSALARNAVQARWAKAKGDRGARANKTAEPAT